MSKKAKNSGLFWTENNLHWLSTIAFGLIGVILFFEPPFTYVLIMLSISLLTIKLIIIRELNLGNVFNTIKVWTGQVSVLSATFALNFHKTPLYFAVFIVLSAVMIITYIIMDFIATVVYNDSQEEK